MDEQKNLSAIEAENSLAAPEEPAKKQGLMRGARDFIENTFHSLKGKDLGQAVEEFTGDMTLVIEGMSEDMAALRRDADKSSAQMTILENDMDAANEARQEEIAALRREIENLTKRIKALEKPDKKPEKPKINVILKQVTWIVGIFSSAWVLVTLLKLIGG